MLRFNHVLSQARCIFTFAHAHTAMLRRLLYPCVHQVPLYSIDPDVARYNRLRESGAETAAEEDVVRRQYDFDVVFFGSCSSRRIFILQLLEAELHRRSISLFTKCAQWNSAMFDSSRHAVVSGAKIVLNLHGDERSVMEAHRVNFLLSMGKCVVSERGADPLMDAEYEAAVHLLPRHAAASPGLAADGATGAAGAAGVDQHDHLDEAAATAVSAAAASAIAALLRDQDELLQCRQRARTAYGAIMSNTTPLATAMDAALAAPRAA